MNKDKKPAAIVPKTTVTDTIITNTTVKTEATVNAKNTMPGA
jgi:hypothetical protein